MIHTFTGTKEQALAHVMRTCCCGGSGSGSGSGGGNFGGGLTNCCGCNHFPDTLAFTWGVGCVGERTGTLTKNSQLSNDCTPDGMGTPFVTYGFNYSAGITGDPWSVVDCVTGSPISSGGGVLEEWDLSLACCGADGGLTPALYKWYFRSTVFKIVGGTRYVVTWNGNTNDIASCSPLVFNDITSTIVCNNGTTLVGICGGAAIGDYTDKPWTPYTNCVGTPWYLYVSA